MALCRKRRERGVDWPLKKHLMHSTGHNIVSVGIEGKYWKFLSDIYTTLIEIKWRWNILIFVSGLVITWFLFACLFYLLCFLHGDLEDQPESFTPCLQNVKTITAAYLFSIETMTTIGYGYRYQTEECPEMYLLVMLQSIIGAGLQFALASLVVSKTRRAKRRSETILFSENVCIYEQDSQLYMVVRVGDIRCSEITGAHAKGYLIRKYKSDDGSLVPVRSFRVQFHAESGRDEIFFPWPTQIMHTVDKDSPLWTLSRDELLDGQYELIVIIDGVCGATCRPFQAKKSYDASEMIWGHRFVSLDLTYSSGGHYVMDLNNFHLTVPTITSLLSAENITNLRQIYSYRTTERTLTPRSSSSDAHASSLDDGSVDRGALSIPGTEPSTRAEISPESRRMAPKRRYSIGAMMRDAQGGKRLSRKRHSIDDALNIYKHRPSITDTYLGAGIEEEAADDSDSLAILSIVSRRSSQKRVHVKDVFKGRQSSGTLLMFKSAESTSELQDSDSQDMSPLSSAPPFGHSKPSPRFFATEKSSAPINTTL